MVPLIVLDFLLVKFNINLLNLFLVIFTCLSDYNFFFFKTEYQDFLSFASEAQSRVSPIFPAQKHSMSSSAVVQMDTSSSGTEQEEVSTGRGMEIVRSDYEEKKNKDESFSASFPMGTEAYHAMSWASKWRDHEDRREIMSSSSSNNHDLANMDWGAVVPENYSWVSHQASNISDGLLSFHSVNDNQVKVDS